MSSADTIAPVDVVAIVCVVESSLDLASEWIHVLVHYVSPLIKRLAECYVGHRFLLGFVTYGCAETRPTPILAKRFFAPIQQVTKELTEDPSKLGIGYTTSSSGSISGMSCLEGLVAALELFDTLRASLERSLSKTHSSDGAKDSRSIVSHLLHIATSAPDGTERPAWNDTTELDDVTWSALPAELRKRDINLTLINLKQTAAFSELHSAVAQGNAQQPWFNVKPPNSVLLYGWPVVSQRVIKRPADAGVEQASDAKRARTSLPSGDPSASIPRHTQSTAAQHPAATHTNVLNPANPSLPNFVTSLQIMQRLQHLDKSILEMDKAIKEARAAGNMENVKQLEREMAAKLTMSKKFKQAIQTAVRAQVEKSASTGGANPSGPPGPPGHPPPYQAEPLPQTQPGPSTSIAPQQRRPPSQSPDIGVASVANDLQEQLAHSMAGQHSSANFTHLSIPPGVAGSSPQLLHAQASSSSQAVQMQKMIEQQQQRRMASHIPLGQAGTGPQQGTPTQQGDPNTNDPTRSVPRQSGRSQWQGMLKWTGFDTVTKGRKEIHAEVTFLSMTDDLRPDMWLTEMNLVPSREPAVSPADLQHWIKRHKPVVAVVHPHSRTIDPKTNDGHYQNLVQLLTDRRMYAMAPLNLPNGTREERILLFAINTKMLAAAVFLNEPMPELPKPEPPKTQPIMVQPNNIPPNIMAQLAKLSPDQRNSFAAQIRQNQLRLQMQQLQHQQHQQQQQQQQLQQAQQPSSSAMQPNMALGYNMNSIPNGSLPAAAGLETGAGMSHPTSGQVASGGGMGNVSMEMLQSFMQRNADGTGGMQ